MGGKNIWPINNRKGVSQTSAGHHFLIDSNIPPCNILKIAPARIIRKSILIRTC